jgi:ligand-binding sensor domain-containing protein
MIRTVLPSYFLLFLLPLSAFTQDYSYTHYDISEGLAGSTAYCITQDKEGFLWIGTESGVSRFDGTHFRNFTTADGLPDVEVLEMFADSRGRIWMAPFLKSVCYYFKGKFHNQENDSALRSIHLKGNIEHFSEDSGGNILIQENTSLHLLKPDGKSTEIDSIHHNPITHCHAISRSRDGYFLLQEKDSVYEYRSGQFIPLFRIFSSIELTTPSFICLSPGIIVWRPEFRRSCIRSLATGEISYIPFAYEHYRHVSYSIVADSLVYSNQSTGSTEYNLHTRRKRIFLPGVEISRVFRDDDGNTWFTTVGQGLYRLNSDEFRNFSLKQPQYGKCSVYAIKKVKNELLLGSNRNSIFRYQLPDMQQLGVQQLNGQERKRILFIDTLDRGRMIYGSDFTLHIMSRRSTDFRGIGMNVKDAFLKSMQELLIASGNGVYLMDLVKFQIIDTLWNERATTLFYRDDTTYIGTLNGLYRITRGHQITFLGKDIPFLRKRISSIVGSRSGVLWIAAYDDSGIVGMKDGRIIRRIGRQQGLTSDICRTLALQGDVLWVGTDKGLNKVDLQRSDARITQYTDNEGLGSNVINSIFVDSPTIYIGTPAGLSLFDETKTNSTASCRLSWLEISSSGRSRIADSSHFLLAYRENNLRVEYAGISYRSAGKMNYKYRLLGLDSTWKFTKETFLEYPTLPSGDYELQITAINRFGINSQPIFLHFAVTTPFWRRGWFVLASFTALIALTWLFVSMRIRYIRIRQQEEKLLSRRMNEMEHMALQAQMNPHFIFNCLNSIQQYIFDQDILTVNKYIAGFSKLIRATLQHSSKSFIPLADEISYLSNYLSLEKLRFKDKMDYSIEVAPSVDSKAIVIPPMLIQPYVENSMRHGLRHKSDGKGYIRIHIERSDSLTVIIEDNGIGRQRAADFKTDEHIEYQSKGMLLTAERIGLMNELYGGDIGVEIVDLKNEKGFPAGTRVVMKFPLLITTSKSKLYDPNCTD